MRKNQQVPDIGRLPPQDIDAEESVLSGCLLNQGMRDTALNMLEGKDFYRTAHQKIFTTIKNMSADGAVSIDLVTVARELKASGMIDVIGGAVYLAKLTDTIPIPANIESHAKIVKETAALRQMITVSNNTMNRCFNAGRGETEDIVAALIDNLFQISSDTTDSSQMRGVSGMEEAVGSAIDSCTAAAQRFKNRDTKTLVTTGFYKIDDLLFCIDDTDYIILGARPGSGKTSLAIQIALHNAKKGIPTAFFSLEMSRKKLTQRLLALEANVGLMKFKRGDFSPDEWSRVMEAADRLSRLPLYIDDRNLPISGIMQNAITLKRLHGIGLFLLDYIQLIPSSESSDKSLNEEFSGVSVKLKGMTKQLNTPLIALSQLSRKCEERSNKRPVLSDLRNSGQLEQDADMIWFIYRDEVYNKKENNPNKGIAEIEVAKNRDGPTGIKHLGFTGWKAEFFNLIESYGR